MAGLGRLRTVINNEGSNTAPGGTRVKRVSPDRQLGLSETYVYEPELHVIKGITPPGYNPPNIPGADTPEVYVPHG